jgi:hypothetical protein
MLFRAFLHGYIIYHDSYEHFYHGAPFLRNWVSVCRYPRPFLSNIHCSDHVAKKLPRNVLLPQKNELFNGFSMVRRSQNVGVYLIEQAWKSSFF